MANGPQKVCFLVDVFFHKMFSPNVDLGAARAARKTRSSQGAKNPWLRSGAEVAPRVKIRKIWELGGIRESPISKLCLGSNKKIQVIQ